MIKEAAELIKKAKRIGIILPDAVDGDSLGSAYALLNILKGANREVKLFFSKPIPPAYQFLNLKTEKAADQIQSETDSPQDFIVSINTTEHPIQEVRYEKEDGVFSIIISPKKSSLKKEDIEFYSGGKPIDLFIAVDIASPEELPSSFDEHLENFSKKPVIAITGRTAEEFFNDVNIFDKKRSSLAESVYLLAEELRYAISPEAATLLLCGIIEKTKNFSLGVPNKNTLSAASSLVALGADKTLTIKNLFSKESEDNETKKSPAEKSAPHTLLQLWGRALVRSRYDEVARIVWSFIPREDFTKTNTTSQDIVFIAKKMAEHLPALRLGIFFLENPHKNHVRVVINPQDATLEEKFVRRFGDSLEKKQGLLIFKNAFPGFIEAENYLLEFLSNIP